MLCLNFSGAVAAYLRAAVGLWSVYSTMYQVGSAAFVINAAVVVRRGQVLEL